MSTSAPAVPDYWYRLEEIQHKLMHLPKARNTVKAYQHAWKIFSGWCSEAGRDALPATPETVSKYITWSLYARPRKLRVATIRLGLAAIARAHQDQNLASPVTPEVRYLVRNAARDLRERKRRKRALEPHHLRRICATLPRDSALGIRDRAMFLLQFAAGWRCSEVAALELADVSFVRQGVLLTLGASKSDQDGKEGREAGIAFGDFEETCPVKALRAWIVKRGNWPGPLFCRIDPGGRIMKRGFGGDTITERLKIALSRIGVPPDEYGSHSLRAGMVTAGIETGATESMIMLRTGHKSLKTMRGYIRPAKAFRSNPLRGVL